MARGVTGPDGRRGLHEASSKALSDDAPPLGELLRRWRRLRRTSQLDLALDAGISARHLSFVETGRSQPSREVVLRLAEELAMPLRERNRLLLAAGFAPVFTQRSLDDPALGAAKQAVERVLAGHMPYPAIAVDRHWTLVSSNAAVAPLLEGIALRLLEPPVNVLRLGLHPEGLAPRIINLREWRAHILSRLHQQLDATADPVIGALAEELRGYPVAVGHQPDAWDDLGGVAVPLRLQSSLGDLAFINTITVFGTPLDLTLAELAIEAFFPADETTATALRAAADGAS
jgi:transcriptional regulator with XRE-family HTH domain